MARSRTELPMHDFEHLRNWRSLSDDQLASRFDEGAAALLRRCVIALGDQQQRQQPITADTFVATVRSMGDLVYQGSWDLSDAIAAADEHLDKNETAQAIACYERFLKSCPSDFYRRIALGQIEKIRGRL